MSDFSSDDEHSARGNASPFSENTLFMNVVQSGVRYVDGDLSDSFVDNISDSESGQSEDDNVESESDGILPGFDDDTDEDQPE